MEEIMAISSGARVNTNISAFNALNALNKVNAELGVHQLRLASGKRINSAADDASGYVISKKMEGRIRSLNAADDNVGDAINLLSVAEGGYATIADLMTQIKDKVTRFNNAGFGTDEQTALAAEIKQLALEVDEARSQTKFNGKVLLDGTFSAGSAVTSSSEAKVGSALTTAAGAATATITKIDASGAGASNMTFSISGSTLTLTKGSTSQSIDLSTALSGGYLAQGTEVSLNFSTLGVSVSVMGTSSGSVSAANLAQSFTAGGVDTLAVIAGSSAAWQVGESSSETFGVAFTRDVSSTGLLGVSAGSITSASITSTFTTNVNNNLANVLGDIGSIGAQVNRMQAKSEMLTTSITNTEAAKSRILDADIAKEQIQAVKLQILQQTATAQLAQANQSPQVFLSLFR